jgi:CubicO group peptidase (beta-lactamase class C family)
MKLEQRIDRVIDDVLERGKIVGAVVLVYRNGEAVYRRAAGYSDRESGVPVQFSTIFRLASVTKPIVAAAALAMADKGSIGLDDNVARYLSWFRPKTADGQAPEITIHHLLTHTSGLAYDPSLELLPDGQNVNLGLLNTNLGFEANFKRLNSIPLAFAPSTGWAYSPATDILGAVLAKAYGGTLEEVISHFVTRPLSMSDTHFHVTDPDRLAVAYADDPSGAVRMPDPWFADDGAGWRAGFSPARIFNPLAYQSGGAGMAGTADDVMRLLDTLRGGGAPILRRETVEAGLSNRIGEIEAEPGARFGYFGAVIHNPGAVGTVMPVGAIQWGGVYGNTWFIDPQEGLTVVSLSNTALEGCIGEYPENLRRAVYGR